LAGAGKHHHRDPGITGVVSAGDRVVILDGMGIDTGIDVDLFLETGSMVERIVGRRLRSECVHTGRIPQSLTCR
jgi:hydroxymethylglutaryl-CoA lyase